MPDSCRLRHKLGHAATSADWHWLSKALIVTSQVRSARLDRCDVGARSPWHLRWTFTK
jgi:hypothetical protein